MTYTFFLVVLTLVLFRRPILSRIWNSGSGYQVSRVIEIGLIVVAIGASSVLLVGGESLIRLSAAAIEWMMYILVLMGLAILFVGLAIEIKLNLLER